MAATSVNVTTAAV